MPATNIATVLAREKEFLQSGELLPEAIMNALEKKFIGIELCTNIFEFMIHGCPIQPSTGAQRQSCRRRRRHGTGAGEMHTVAFLAEFGIRTFQRCDGGTRQQLSAMNSVLLAQLHP